MSYTQSWTDESTTTPTNSSEDQEKTNSSNYSTENRDNRKAINKDLYKICTEQIIVHRWFLSDIQSLNNQKQDFYLQSSSFGCTGENGLLQWIIRFYPKASKNKPSFSFIDHNECCTKVNNNSALNEISKHDDNAHQNLLNTLRNMINNKENQNSLSYIESFNQLLNEILLKPISNIEHSITTTNEHFKKVISSEKTVHIPILNHDILKTLPQYSITTSEEESSSDDKSYCAFEILKVNGYEQTSQTLFETNYQVFEIADDGILNLLKTEGRHQVHFNRALIILPHDTIFSISSNNILFSIKLIIYECSSTIDNCQSMSYHNKIIKNLSFEQPLHSNISSGDTNKFYNYNPMIELSIGNIYWLMSMNKLFTDIIIYSSDNQEFHVHRLILYTACEKFTKFISINQQMNKIQLDFINGINLKRILKYIYTGEIEICIGEFLIDEIRDLLNAADLFELFHLKNILTKKCLNHITQKNCFELLQLADDKQMKILKNRILTFLCQEYPQETFVNLLRLNQLQKSIIENNIKKKKQQP
ncbi:unnamed protein product [Rotaria sordida]|uniref:BTB domain-containing protein n=1 Tax=Rotaria sordida TaxID=392033 RepID=A0A818GRN9_9BILA|nr:unnamed protein product [Rotaria sordida]